MNEDFTISGKWLDPLGDIVRSQKEQNVNEYVLGFLFSKIGAVALVTKVKPEWQRNRLNGIGGKVEPTDETVVDAMVRECKEETKVETTVHHWRKFARMINKDNSVIHCFVCHLNEIPVLHGCEEEPVHWYYPRELPFVVIPNLKWLIPLSQDYSAPVFTLDYRDGK